MGEQRGRVDEQMWMNGRIVDADRDTRHDTLLKVLHASGYLWMRWMKESDT
jgi:hypothetical protein